MLYLGCHLSASAGYLHMGQEAISIGANTFQFFTRNPRGGTATPLALSAVAPYQHPRHRANRRPRALYPQRLLG